jgi:transposase-like protein
MDNYPPGAKDDPAAPYNQKDYEYDCCPECGSDNFDIWDSGIAKNNTEWQIYKCNECNKIFGYQPEYDAD